MSVPLRKGSVAALEAKVAAKTDVKRAIESLRKAVGLTEALKIVDEAKLEVVKANPYEARIAGWII